jgi:hypothetical protein
MSEDNKRSTSFAEAGAKLRIKASDSLDAISEWAEDYQDKLQDAAEAAQKESEDKGFWGKIATYGSTLGCIALDMAAPGVCTVAGLMIGTGTRIGVDIAGDAEEQVPGAAKAVAVDYYRNKAPEIAEELNKGRDQLNDFHANEWKADLIGQLSDSFNAYKMSMNLDKMGLFDDFVPDGEDVVSKTVLQDEGSLMSVINDEFKLDIDIPDIMEPGSLA